MSGIWAGDIWGQFNALIANSIQVPSASAPLFSVDSSGNITCASINDSGALAVGGSAVFNYTGNPTVKINSTINQQGVWINSGNTSASVCADLYISRASSSSGVGHGSNVQMNDSTTGVMLQQWSATSTTPILSAFLYNGSVWAERFRLQDSTFQVFSSVTGPTSGIYSNGGDITAARTGSTGVIYFGTDGNGYLYRSAASQYTLCGGSSTASISLGGGSAGVIGDAINNANFSYGTVYCQNAKNAWSGYAIYNGASNPTFMANTTNYAGVYAQGTPGGWLFGWDASQLAFTAGGKLAVETMSTTATSPNVTVGTVANGLTGTNCYNFYLYTSLRKNKHDIRSVTDEEAERVLKLRPVRYRSRCEADNPDWSWYGLIAEEVEEIDPRFASYQQGELAGVQYDRVAIMMLPLLKKLVERVDHLEKKYGYH